MAMLMVNRPLHSWRRGWWEAACSMRWTRLCGARSLALCCNHGYPSLTAPCMSSCPNFITKNCIISRSSMNSNKLFPHYKIYNSLLMFWGYWPTVIVMDDWEREVYLIKRVDFVYTIVYFIMRILMCIIINRNISSRCLNKEVNEWINDLFINYLRKKWIN